MFEKSKKCVKLTIKEVKMKDLKFYLNKALKNHFALGAFNFCNMESLQAIINASLKAKSPAIISVSESALSYMGEDFVMALAKIAKKQNPALFLHLDHGKSFEVCKKAVELGFDSVMIDGSALDFEKNVKLTKKVCAYAHKKGVLVEGEIGQIKGIEDNVKADQNIYTNPEEAYKFARETGVDLLAVAIGTSHGVNKYSKNPTLRMDILSEIEKLLPSLPLVLHGASTVDEALIKTFNDYGGQLTKAKGVSEELLMEAVTKHNIVKINTDTDIRLSFTSETRKILSENKKEIDPRKYLGKGKEKAEEILLAKMKNVLFSAGKK